MLKKLTLLALLLGLAFGVMLLTTRDSRFEVSSILEMPQPPERIWRQLVRVEAWPRWWPGVEDAGAEAPLAPGVKIGLRLRGRPEQGPAVVIRFEPGRQLVWQRDGVFGSRTQTGLSVQSGGSGSRVQVSHRIEGPQAFLARFTGREAFEKYQRTLLAALRDDLEGRHGLEQKKD